MAMWPAPVIFIALSACALEPRSGTTVDTRPAVTEASTSLENTYWKLIQVGKLTVAAQSPEPGITLDATTRRASGFSGCNNFSARYTPAKETLTFERIASTRKGCLDPAHGEVESMFLQALEQAYSWRIDGRHLNLLDRAAKVLARFEAVARKAPEAGLMYLAPIRRLAILRARYPPQSKPESP